MIKVSAIVPVYQSKSTLVPCVNALLRQGLENIEVIIVDDCSPDNTYEFAKNTYQDNEKVRVFRMAENGGPGLARNRGIEEARGEYICFCDSDDCYRDGAIRTMYEEAVRFNADVYDTTEVYLTVVKSLPDDLSTIPDENLVRYGFIPPEKAFDEETPVFAGDIESRMDGWFRHVFHWSSIAKLYKTAFLNRHRIRFPAMRIAEDQLFILDNLIHADVYVMQNRCCYTIRTGVVNSVTRGKESPRVFISAIQAMFESLECMERVFRDEPFFEAHPEYKQKLTDFQVDTLEREFAIPKYKLFGREQLSKDENVRKVFTDYFGNKGAFIEKTLFDSYDQKTEAASIDYDGTSLYEKLKPFAGANNYLCGA